MLGASDVRRPDHKRASKLPRSSFASVPRRRWWARVTDGGSASPSRCRSAAQPRDPFPCQRRHVVATAADHLVAACRTGSATGTTCLLPEPGDRGGNGLVVRCGLEGAEGALELRGVKHEWTLPLVHHLGGRR